MAKNIDIGKELKGMKPQQFIYPGILLILFILIFVNFYMATQFLGKSITDAYSTPSEASVAAQTQVPNIDMSAYNTAIQKVAAGSLNPLSTSTPFSAPLNNSTPIPPPPSTATSSPNKL